MKKGRNFDHNCGLIEYEEYPYFLMPNFITMHHYAPEKMIFKA
jgi:hypothetical protein